MTSSAGVVNNRSVIQNTAVVPVLVSLDSSCNEANVCRAVIWELLKMKLTYEGWNFNSGNYLFTTDTK